MGQAVRQKWAREARPALRTPPALAFGAGERPFDTMLLTSLALALSPLQASTPPNRPLPGAGTATSSPKPYSPPMAALLGPCNQFSPTLCVPLDGSFETVPFSLGLSCDRNDDGSAELMLSSWSFDFYGTAWPSIFVNNNGNVSFGQDFSAYSSSGFPIAGFPMVAPFWGDVDTRGDDGTDGVVWYREWSTANGDPVNRMVVTWDRVGFFSSNTSLLNTFQLILTDGADPLIGVGNNVCFCYDDMQWTTGGASGGSGGFGGTPATVGANQGNGTDFFQIGRFDAAGNAYDGPDGANDGVDYLDGQTICFSVGSGGTNVPPVFVNSQNSFDVEVGQTLTFAIEAIGPESGQTVTLAVDAAGLANFSSVENSGSPATSSATFVPALDQLGTHVVTFTGTDDGTPAASSVWTVEILVLPVAILGATECDPNAANSTGRSARLWATGSPQAGANDLTLRMADLPPSAFGLVAVSQSTGVLSQFGGSQGEFCLNGSDIGRYNQAVFNAGPDGRFTLAVDLMQIPTAPGSMVPAIAGETWGWQLWYRDNNPGPVSNFSNAVRVTFQ